MPRDRTGHFYFAWFPTIYQQDTQHLSLSECGAYRRLIDHYMMTRAPLPRDDKSLARIIGVTFDEWLAVKETIVKFFKPSGTIYTHTFCDAALQKDMGRILRAQENGKQRLTQQMENLNLPPLKYNENNPLGTQSVHPDQNRPKQIEQTMVNNRSENLDISGLVNGYLQASGQGGEFIPTEGTVERLRDIAPGWNQHELLEKYNAWHVGKERPHNQQAAFLGWARRFTMRK